MVENLTEGLREGKEGGKDRLRGLGRETLMAAAACDLCI